MQLLVHPRLYHSNSPLQAAAPLYGMSNVLLDHQSGFEPIMVYVSGTQSNQYV